MAEFRITSVNIVCFQFQDPAINWSLHIYDGNYTKNNANGRLVRFCISVQEQRNKQWKTRFKRLKVATNFVILREIKVDLDSSGNEICFESLCWTICNGASVAHTISVGSGKDDDVRVRACTCVCRFVSSAASHVRWLRLVPGGVSAVTRAIQWTAGVSARCSAQQQQQQRLLYDHTVIVIYK